MLLKKQIVFEVSYFAKNIYQTVTGTSGLDEAGKLVLDYVLYNLHIR